MFSHLSTEPAKATMSYPRLDDHLPFSDYILQCQQLIATRRMDLDDRTQEESQKIITANSPFEYSPQNVPTNQAKIGVLLIHGLLDCPFTYRELAESLRAAGMHVQTVLLQGHGTRSSDLLHVNYQEWLQTVHYGIENLRRKVDKIFVVGYSTGGALALVDVAQGNHVDGLVLCAPAIKLRVSIDATMNWITLTNKVLKDRQWIYQIEENDYVKYKSITLNGAVQVSKLTDIVRDDVSKAAVTQPIFMVLSKEDETISSPDSIDYFKEVANDKSRLLIYSSDKDKHKDARIEVRSSIYPDLHINNLSHSALMFSANNFHYGVNGDYQHTSNNETNHIDGAYNRIEVNASELMAKYNLMKSPRRILTYNPDFPQLAKEITEFILTR